MAQTLLSFPESLATPHEQQRDWPNNPLHGPKTAHYLRDCAYKRCLPVDEETKTTFGFDHAVFPDEIEDLLAFYGTIFFTIGVSPDTVATWAKKYDGWDIHLFKKLAWSWIDWYNICSARPSLDFSIGTTNRGPSPLGERRSWNQPCLNAIFATFMALMRIGYDINFGATRSPRTVRRAHQAVQIMRYLAQVARDEEEEEGRGRRRSAPKVSFDVNTKF